MPTHRNTLSQALDARALQPRGVPASWTGADSPMAVAHVLLDEMVERQAALTPDAPAVQDGRSITSYAELVGRARSLAKRLQRHRIATSDLVAVCMDRCTAQLVSVLGVLMAGAAYVPIDPRGPAERREFMLEDSDPRVIVTNIEAGRSIPSRFRSRVVLMEDANGDESELLPVLRRPDDLAYVIYTSGSSGVPKGVLNQHDGITNHLAWMASAFPLGTRDRILAKTSSLFDVSIWEWFWPLSQGACLVLTAPGEEADLSRIVSAIESHHITNIHFVPTLLRVFLQRQRLDRCQSLERIFCSGEALPADLRDAFFERLPRGLALINLYGPTEAAVHVVGWICAPDETGPVPIGRPLPNVRAYIVDRNLHAVPEGVRGELLIGGIQAARGYLRRPELTAERFIPDPFGADPRARCYRTGDCVSWRADGAIEFHGRFDSQVQLGGARVELGEIEATLRLHPFVADAAVAFDGTKAAGRLVAYLRRVHKGEPGRDPSVDSLRSTLTKKLPAYMIPARYIWLDDFPLTPSGKLDTRALSAVDTARDESRPFEQPRPGIETCLARIWETVLQIDRVGRHDDFYLLGGDSLSSIALTETIDREFGVELSPLELWRLPTIALLCERIQFGTNARSNSSLVLLQPGAGSEPLFLPPSMDGQLFCWRELIGALRPGRAVYGFRLSPSRPGVELRELAAGLVRDLIAFRPDGPYHLAGHSFSAGLALEMAHQLRSSGRTVGVLGMIDYGPGEPDAGWKAGVRTAAHFIENLPGWLRYDILQSDWTALSARIQRKLSTLRGRLVVHATPAGIAHAERVADEIFGTETLSASNRRVVIDNLASFFQYRPARYDGRVLLLWARCRPLFHSLAPTLGWEHYAAAFTRVIVACNHDNILKPPHVAVVAAALDDAMDRFSVRVAGQPVQASAAVGEVLPER